MFATFPNINLLLCVNRGFTVKEPVASSDAHSIHVSSLFSGNASIACPALSVFLCRNERSSGVACSPSSSSCTAACLSLPQQKLRGFQWRGKRRCPRGCHPGQGRSSKPVSIFYLSFSTTTHWSHSQTTPGLPFSHYLH